MASLRRQVEAGAEHFSKDVIKLAVDKLVSNKARIQTLENQVEFYKASAANDQSLNSDLNQVLKCQQSESDQFEAQVLKLLANLPTVQQQPEMLAIVEKLLENYPAEASTSTLKDCVVKVLESSPTVKKNEGIYNT
ncbi:hypothetical protein Btru_036508 [Bulinus truncatus]|nr:hypothetical protein Btru_036508 [Bulinus truncatus]